MLNIDTFKKNAISLFTMNRRSVATFITSKDENHNSHFFSYHFQATKNVVKQFHMYLFGKRKAPLLIEHGC